MAGELFFRSSQIGNDIFVTLFALAVTSFPPKNVYVEFTA